MSKQSVSIEHAVSQAARDAYRAGLCPIPAKEDGTKSPDVTGWKEYVQRDDNPNPQRPSIDQYKAWYGDETRSGIGLFCGPVSGDVEALDFDLRAIFDQYVTLAESEGLADLLDRIRAGYEEHTPNGVHLLYRCEENGCVKLAYGPRPDEHGEITIKTLIETKGNGGYIVTAPSNGRVHPSGKPYVLATGGFDQIVTITPEERERLFRLARQFDELPEEPQEPTPKTITTPDPDRNLPGDDFNRRATWADVLEPHGWKNVSTDREGITYWRRPGSENKHSATTNATGTDTLIVFSTSTFFRSFVPGSGRTPSYTKFAAYAVLNHGGDFAAAAGALADEGYGDPYEEIIINNHGTRDTTRTSASPSWPDPIAPEAYHGLAGEIVEYLASESEADPVAILVQLLAAVGNIIGRDPRWYAGGEEHSLKVWPVLVGETARARKGTSWNVLGQVLRRAAPEWYAGHVTTGLSSAEGLIYHVRDATYREEPIKENRRIVGTETVCVDPGIEDKRLCVMETEFASVMQRAGREGNTLFATLRQAWDGGDLRTMTKNNPVQATGAHVTVMGHITKDELLRTISTTEAANGFANRFLWVCVRRSKLLPLGGNLDPTTIATFADQLATVLETAQHIGYMERTPAADRIWERVYGALSDSKATGLLDAITTRAEAYVMRLGAIYAVLDESCEIEPVHLEAALAVWQYCEDSARVIFGDALGDPDADAILTALREMGELSQSDISTLVFGRNVSVGRIQRALARLVALGRIDSAERQPESGKGRPALIWRLKMYERTKETKEMPDE